MTYYTENLVPNPAFQLGTLGYSGLLSTSVQLDPDNMLFGSQTLLVQCPGDTTNEGVITDGGYHPDDTIGSASLYITGSGDVTVYAMCNPGNTVVASVPVTLTPQWTRVVFSALECTAGQTVSLTAETNSPQAVSFWISAVQVESTSPAHPYCDGDQDGCIWEGGGRGGISAQLFSNPVSAVSNSYTNSQIVVLSYGLISDAVPVPSSSFTYSPVVSLAAAGPFSALTDFSVALLTDPDPAQTYVSWNNGGVTATSSYVRPWGIFIPPKDYIVSDGSYLYRKAAYFAQGMLFPSAPTSTNLTVTNVQAEVLPLTTGYSAPSPTAFDSPRDIHSVIVADRINYCANPSFEISTAGWSAVGTSVLSRSTSVTVGQIAEYDDSVITTGTHSLQVQVNSSGDGTQTTIADLITGRNYTVSAYIAAGEGIFNILMNIDGTFISILDEGGAGYGTGTYGGGFYGGIDTGTDLPTGVWYRLSGSFTATSDSHVLEITASTASDVSFPSDIWIDGVLVEPGELLKPYFDGSLGGNYTWDSASGSPGLAKSYYYDQMPLKQQAVNNILSKHMPLGINHAAPLYSVPPLS
jgi:hypothetical protein